MEDLDDKVTGGAVTAAQWNQVPGEIQNVITSSGQTLSGGDLNQLGKGVADYVARSSHYTGGGTADAQTCTPHGSLLAPNAYAEGMEIRWTPTNTNATATPTVNVNSLGAKTIVNSEGGALTVGQLSTVRDAVAVYDGTDFRLDETFSGLRVLLDSETISSGVSEVLLTANDWPATYDRVLVEIDALTLASYTTSQLQVEPIDNGTPRSTNIQSQFVGSRATGTAIHAQSAGWYLTDKGSDIGADFVDVKMEATSHPGPRMGFTSQTAYIHAANAAVLNTAGILDANATRLDGFRIFAASINIDAGRFRMFGLPKS